MLLLLFFPCRYESGLDNSPQYDGNDPNSPGMCGGTGPVRFNSNTSHMELFDVAFTSYFVLDVQALLRLAVKVPGIMDNTTKGELQSKC